MRATVRCGAAAVIVLLSAERCGVFFCGGHRRKLFIGRRSHAMCERVFVFVFFAGASEFPYTFVEYRIQIVANVELVNITFHSR